jgi:hypothetical protein
MRNQTKESKMHLLPVLIAVLVIVALIIAVDWVGFPNPLNWIVKAILFLIGAAYVLQALGFGGIL